MQASIGQQSSRARSGITPADFDAWAAFGVQRPDALHPKTWDDESADTTLSALSRNGRWEMSTLAAGAAFKSGLEWHGTTPSIMSRNATKDMSEMNLSVGTAMQDCPPPDAQQQDQNSSQTASDGPCSSRASLLLPTTFTSDVWSRLPASTQELMQESLSSIDSELGMSCMQQHPVEAGPGPAAEGAPHATARYKLNAMSVAHIFLQKRSTPQDRKLSSWLAAQYGVTPKAVRDIWNGRTWTSITQLL
jgi:hypothetical protein